MAEQPEHSPVGAVIDEGLEKVVKITSAAGEQARSVAEDASAAAQDLARKARDQAVAAGDTLCKQGTQASDYLAARVSENPLPAVIIAAAIGYGLALMMRNREAAH